jgi:hypothetical protein
MSEQVTEAHERNQPIGTGSSIGSVIEYWMNDNTPVSVDAIRQTSLDLAGGKVEPIISYHNHPTTTFRRLSGEIVKQITVADG